MDRKYPITSYGLIVYSRDTEGKNKYLIYQRRDTFEYMEFLRGCWTSRKHIPSLFSLMSREERERIRDYTFEELWDDLWVCKTCRVYREGFARAKKKFESIKQLIPNYLDETDTKTAEPPWGWPKGKKNKNSEDPIGCALREFEEETRIDKNFVKILDEPPYSERFKGSDHKTYATFYYLAYLENQCMPDYIHTPECIRKTMISEEVSNLKWISFEDACMYLNPRRINILRTIEDKI